MLTRAARVAWAGGALVATLLVLAALGRNRLYSNPEKPRENPAYELAHAAGGTPPTPDPNIFGQVAVSTNGPEIRIRVPSSAGAAESLPLGTVVTGTNVVPFAGAVATLRNIGIYYALRSGERNEPQYYSASGELQDYDKIRALVDLWRGNLHFQGVYPRVAFFVELMNLPSAECIVLGFQAFDRRTRRSLLTGYSSAVTPGGPARIWIGANVELWHQTPVELVLTLATGPTQVSSHRVDVHGPAMVYPGGALKLIYITDGAINSWGSDSGGGTNTVTLQKSPDDAETRSSLAFFGWPRVQGMPLDIQINGLDGNPAQHTGRSSSDNLLICGLKAQPAQLGSIELRYYPQVYRLIFQLDELPGLPPENRHLKNLFDTRIPYVKFPDDWKYQDAVRKLTAMQAPSHVPLTYPNSFFPVVRTNITVRELFEEMERMASDRTRIFIVDAEKNEIRQERSIVHESLQKIRKLLKM